MKAKREHLERLGRLAKTHRFEICGILSCTPDGEPASMYEAVNVAHKPKKMYRISPIWQARIFDTMKKKGEQLQAIYHSHPNSAPIPSTEDTEHAFYPDAVYIIIGRGPGGMPIIRAYSIAEPPTYHEVQIEIV